MKGAVYYNQGDIRVVDVKEPQISRPDSLKIKISWCGICGSDMVEYIDGPVVVPTTPHTLTGRQAPLILGHEFSGEVVDVGSSVNRFKIGDRIIANPILSCGECYWCQKGIKCLCPEIACVGLASDGAFAGFVLMPEENCYRVPEGVSLDRMSLVEPVAIAIRALKKIGSQDDIAIIGAGTIGLLIVQVAKAMGISRIFVVDILQKRLALARDMGAIVYNMKDYSLEELKKDINQISSGLGPHIIECAGTSKTPDIASSLANKGRTIILVGITAGRNLVNTNDIVLSEKKVLGSHGYSVEDFELAQKLLLNRRVEIDDLISKKIKLDNIVEEGFKALRSEPDRYLKILVSP